MGAGSVVGSVVVRLIADLTNLKTNIMAATGLIRKFANTALLPIKTVQGAFTAAFNFRNLLIGGAMGATVKKIIDVGAAAEQTEHTFATAFGEMQDEARAWSEGLGNQLKRSASDIRSTSADMQFFLTGMGLGTKEAAKMSTALTELAYTMSQRLGTPTDAIWAIRAALNGSNRALIQWGYAIKEDELRLWAHKNGLNENTKAWSEQQLIVAREAVLLEKAGREMNQLNQGQERTKNILASLRDQFTDVSEAIFKEWKPTIDAAFQGLRDWLLENQGRIATFAGDIVRDLRSILSFLGSEWQNGWQKTGEAIQVILEATLDAISVILESAIVGIGTKIPGWLIKGFSAASKVGLKAFQTFGMKLAEEIDKGINAGMKFVFGEGVQQLNTDFQATLGRAEEGARQTSAKLATIGADLQQKLSRIAQESRVLNAPISVPDMKESMLAWIQGSQAVQVALGPTIEAAKELGTSMKSAFEAAGKKPEEIAADLEEVTNKMREENAALNLLSQGLFLEAEQLKIVNDLKQKGDELDEKQKRQIRELLIERGRLNYATFLRQMQEENDLRLLSIQGLELEAEARKVINDLREKGILIGPEEENQIRRMIATQDEALRVAGVWRNAAQAITSSFEDAFIQITKNFHNLREVAENVANAIQETFARAVYQQTLAKPIESFVGRLIRGVMPGATTGTTTGTTTGAGGQNQAYMNELATGGYQRGGIVKPLYRAQGGIIYAARGLLIPKGTDTVPAMLTPGEGVFDADLTKRLRQTLAVAEPSPPLQRPININVQALDAASVVQLFQRYGRVLASVMQNEQGNNHPFRRNSR